MKKMSRKTARKESKKVLGCFRLLLPVRISIKVCGINTFGFSNILSIFSGIPSSEEFSLQHSSIFSRIPSSEEFSPTSLF